MPSSSRKKNIHSVPTRTPVIINPSALQSDNDEDLVRIVRSIAHIDLNWGAVQRRLADRAHDTYVKYMEEKE